MLPVPHMRFAGLPLWTIVLVACVALPFVLRVWIDAEQRRAKERTLAIIKELNGPGRAETEVAAKGGAGDERH